MAERPRDLPVGSPADARADLADAPSVSPIEFRAAVGSFVTGVTIVTAQDLDTDLGAEDGAAGDVAMTASAFMSVSLEPPLIAIGVGSTTRMFELLGRQQRWAVSILPHDRRHLASRFAQHNRPGDRLLFADLASRRGPYSGALLLDHALVTMECLTEQMIPAGDHLLTLGRVVALESPAPERTPLVYFRSRFRRLADRGRGDSPARGLG